MFHNGYAVMKRVYGLAIFLSNTTERFERFAYNWLDAFENGDTWA